MMVYDATVDPSWKRQDDHRKGEDYSTQVLKLARTDERLVLLAKAYTGAVPETLGEIGERDWTEQYAQIFDTVTNVRVSRSQLTLIDRVVPALDVIGEGTTIDGAQRVRERYACSPGHQLIVSAIGSATAHARFAADIDHWFANIVFRPVRSSRAWR